MFSLRQQTENLQRRCSPSPPSLCLEEVPKFLKNLKALLQEKKLSDRPKLNSCICGPLYLFIYGTFAPKGIYWKFLCLKPKTNKAFSRNKQML